MSLSRHAACRDKSFPCKILKVRNWKMKMIIASLLMSSKKRMVVNNISNCCCGQERPFRERNARCQLPGESIKDIWLLYVNISSVRNTASGWYYYYYGTVPHLLTNTLSSLRCLKWNEPGNFARFGNVASTLPPTALPPTTTQLPHARRKRINQNSILFLNWLTTPSTPPTWPLWYNIHN